MILVFLITKPLFLVSAIALVYKRHRQQVEDPSLTLTDEQLCGLLEE